LDFKPSVIGGASLILALNIIAATSNDKHKVNLSYWNQQAEAITGFQRGEFLHCLKLMASIFTSINIDYIIQSE